MRWLLFTRRWLCEGWQWNLFLELDSSHWWAPARARNSTSSANHFSHICKKWKKRRSENFSIYLPENLSTWTIASRAPLNFLFCVWFVIFHQIHRVAIFVSWWWSWKFHFYFQKASMGYVCLFFFRVHSMIALIHDSWNRFGWSVSINDKWPIASVYAHKYTGHANGNRFRIYWISSC